MTTEAISSNYPDYSQLMFAQNPLLWGCQPNFKGTQSFYPVQSEQNSTFESPKRPQDTSNQEESKSSFGAIAGSIAAIGVTAACILAHKKGVGNGTIEKIKDGFSKIYESARGKISSKIHPEKLTYTEINGRKVCTVPNRSNIITDEHGLAEIGASTDIPYLTKIENGKTVLNDGIALRRYSFDVRDSSGNITGTIMVKNGKLFKYTDASGKDILKEGYTDAAADVKKAIDDSIQAFNKGENLEKLNKIRFTHSDNGVTKVYSSDIYNGYFSTSMDWAASNRFALNSDAVNAYRIKNESVDQALKNIVKKGKTDGFKIVSADYHIPGAGTVKIKDGKIAGIVEDGVFYNTESDRYIVLAKEFEKEFEKIFKDKTLLQRIRGRQNHFDNAVYQAI